jgi:hypothetical protein
MPSPSLVFAARLDKRFQEVQHETSIVADLGRVNVAEKHSAERNRRKSALFRSAGRMT